MKKNIIYIKRNSLQFCKSNSSLHGHSNKLPIDYDKKLVINPKIHLYYWDNDMERYKINTKQIICIYDSKPKKNIKFKFSHTVDLDQYPATKFVYVHNSGLPIYSCDPSGIMRTYENFKLHINLSDEFNPLYSPTCKERRRKSARNMWKRFMNDKMLTLSDFTNLHNIY